MHVAFKRFETDIRMASPLFIGGRDASSSSAMHPLFPLGVQFAIIIPGIKTPSELYHPLYQSTFIRQASDEHPLKFRQFCPFLERMKTDGATLRTPVILLAHGVFFAYVLCLPARGTGIQVLYIINMLDISYRRNEECQGPQGKRLKQ